MATKITRYDWFKFFPSDFMNSPDVIAMSSAARGAYISLLCACWLNNAKGCGIPDNENFFLRVTNCTKKEWRKISKIVLAKFSSANGMLYNARLLVELDSISKQSLTNAENASQRQELLREEKKAQTLSLQQSNSALAVPAPCDPIPKQVRTQDHREKEEEIEGETEKEKEKAFAIMPSKGQPGYFEDGQYPGGKNPEGKTGIFLHMAQAWDRIIGGGAAALKYPSQYPESWELLCRQKGTGDVIVPAFELWLVEQGHVYKDSKKVFVLGEFMRVAPEYMARISPLNLLEKKGAPVLLSAHEQIAADPALAAIIAAQSEEIRNAYRVVPKEAAIDEAAEGEADLAFYLGGDEGNK